MANTTDYIERQIPFTPELFEAVKKSADSDLRSFKLHAMVLIEEAIAAREAEAMEAAAEAAHG